MGECWWRWMQIKCNLNMLVKFWQTHLYCMNKLPNTLIMYNNKPLTSPFFWNVKCVITCACVYIMHVPSRDPTWFQYLLPLNVSSFIAHWVPYWSPDAKGTSWPELLFLKDHMHKTFPFGNYRMEKRIFLSLGRPIRHNIITHFIENLKPKIQ
jgi:hypothetical protein